MPIINYTKADVERMKEQLRNLYALLSELESNNKDGENDRLIQEIINSIKGLEYELSGEN